MAARAVLRRFAASGVHRRVLAGTHHHRALSASASASSASSPFAHHSQSAVLDGRVDTKSDEFIANKAEMDGAIAGLRERLAAVRGGGGEKARAKHEGRGKMFVRDRVDALLDPGSPFLELSQVPSLPFHRATLHVSAPRGC